MELRDKCPNTEFFISPRIQSECGKIQTRKNSVFGHFPRSVRQEKYLSFMEIEVFVFSVEKISNF